MKERKRKKKQKNLFRYAETRESSEYLNPIRSVIFYDFLMKREN